VCPCTSREVLDSNQEAGQGAALDEGVAAALLWMDKVVGANFAIAEIAWQPIMMPGRARLQALAGCSAKGPGGVMLARKLYCSIFNCWHPRARARVCCENPCHPK